MGKDVYLKWEGQTEKEKSAQYTGFDITAGKVGYLRERYGEAVSALSTFLPEEWEGDIVLPAAKLKERLPETLKKVAERYSGSKFKKQAMQSYRDFVKLAEKKEREIGKPCSIYVSY